MIPALAVALLLGATAPGAEPLPDPVEAALSALELERRDLAPDPFRLLSSSTADRQTPMLRALLADPLGAPSRAGMADARFRAIAESPLRLMIQAVGTAGIDIARGYLGNPLAPVDAHLASAGDPLAAAFAYAEQVGGKFDWRDRLPDEAALPNPARLEVARLVMVAATAHERVTQALRKLPAGLDRAQAVSQLLNDASPADPDSDFRVLIRDVHDETLAAAQLDLVAAAEDFDAWARTADVPALDWSIETPLGSVVLSLGTGASKHEVKAPLLVVDLGGDDQYLLGERARKVRGGVSLVYDRSGNDTHACLMGAGGAAGVFGCGVLWDAAGDDIHQGGELCQAAAFFGMAALIEGGGNDRYDAITSSQARAVAGAALLVDYAGDDRYTAVTRSQASAGPSGGAVLLDLAGNDTYDLRNEPLMDPSAQSPKHNVSMGQGAGEGFRADLSDGLSCAGGVAILMDGAGDDRYSAQVFCQGTGFLEGVGLLVDNGGSDEYAGIWYAQGSAAHRAAGGLIDRGPGADTMTAEISTSIAAGHDYSVAFVINEGTDADTYSLGNLGLGAGNDNGFGLFADAGGDDTYKAAGKAPYAFGQARITNWGTARESQRNVGLFFDLGGTDSYPPAAAAKQDSLWPMARRYPDLNLQSECGVGLDGSYRNPFFTVPRTDAGKTDANQIEEARKARRQFRTPK